MPIQNKMTYKEGKAMNFCENLRRCKEEAGYTIEELSRLSGVPVGTLSKLLSGAIAEPKVSVVLALASGLSCPLSHLLDPTGTYVSETLDDEEREVLADYRRLDTHSRELVRLVMEKQLSLAAFEAKAPKETVSAPEKRARILSMPDNECEAVRIPLFDLPVSAGTGEFLDAAHATHTITLPAGSRAMKGDFALRVNGHSMEPRFNHGDVLWVRGGETPDIGEFGIFLADGEGYFKKYMGDRLVSLNPDYDDILLAGFADVRCCGRVVGRLGRKKS